MEDQAVGDQMIVLDDLALLITAVLGDDAFAAEESPFEKAVELLAFVSGLDRGPQLLIGQVAQQKARPDRPPQFAEGQIEPVLAAVGNPAAVGSSPR